MNKFFRAVVALVFMTSLANAQIINGDFTTPGGVGWSVVPGSAVNFTVSAPRTANITTPDGAPAASAASIESALGLSAGTISTIATNSQAGGRLPAGVGEDLVFDGSAIFQNFGAAAGDVITFNFAHDDDSANRDVAFASLVRLSDTSLVPATVGPDGFPNAGVLEPALVGFANPLTGNLGSWTIATTGTYRIGFAIVNTGDNSRTANFEIDQVRGATAIPEINVSSAGLPVALMLMAFAFVADSRRRQSLNA